ncbi:MAG: hypothetical protein R2854_28880 [Caldilineaceae bacterium]
MDELLAMARTWEGLDGRDLVREVTCQEPYHWIDGTQVEWTPVPARAGGDGAPGGGRRRRCAWWSRTTLASSTTSCGGWPATACASPWFRRHTGSRCVGVTTDGIFLSNVARAIRRSVPYAAASVQTLLTSDIPMFGICLGHQVIRRALGAGDVQAQVRPPRRLSQPVSDVDSTNVQIRPRITTTPWTAPGCPPMWKSLIAISMTTRWRGCG